MGSANLRNDILGSGGENTYREELALNTFFVCCKYCEGLPKDAQENITIPEKNNKVLINIKVDAHLRMRMNYEPCTLRASNACGNVNKTGLYDANGLRARIYL